MPLVVSEPLQYPRKHPFPEVLKNSPVDDSIQKPPRTGVRLLYLKVHRICPLPFMKISIFDTFKKTLEPYHQQYFKQTLLCGSLLLVLNEK